MADGDGIDEVADRLAGLLGGADGRLSDPGRSGITFEPSVLPHALVRGAPPAECWAVDGGQSLVADARTVQVYATRVATVHWQPDTPMSEEQGELRIHLLGCGEERRSLAALDSPVAPDAAVDVNLLRDWGEWSAVSAAVDRAGPGAVVLVDGDLQPDWRIPSSWLAELMERAAARGVVLAGVTKHSGLARGGAPLLGLLEVEAAAALGQRATWWARIGGTRPDVGPGLAVLAARLDPDAPFAFRVDLPAGTDAGAVLGALSALCEDAAFPGYPYPLTVADRLAACAGWVRQDLWDRLTELLGRAGIPAEVLDRAFSDRHRLMERA